MENLLENLAFSINGIAPVFLMIFIGVLLKRFNIINDNFVSVSSNVVFKMALPALVFNSIASTDFMEVFNPKMIIFMLTGTLAMTGIIYYITTRAIKERHSRGAFVQGVFRSNYAIIGMPLILNLFGQTGFAKSAIAFSFVLPLYNILAVVVLAASAPETEGAGLKGLFKQIITNPLIIAVIIAVPFSLAKITIPTVIQNTIDYATDLSVPLALLGIGGQFNFSRMKSNIRMSATASVLKVIVIPLVFSILAVLLGFRGDELGSIFMLFASPTAVSSFVMAKSMHNDSNLAADIIMLTTIGSIFSIFTGITVLRALSLI